MTSIKKIAVIAFQLGGPDTLAAVEPFLYNLFCDPDIINFPGSFLARKPLAKWISTTRSKTVGKHYAEIGGGSPIRRLTEQQAAALESALAQDARVADAVERHAPAEAQIREPCLVVQALAHVDQDLLQDTLHAGGYWAWTGFAQLPLWEKPFGLA